MGNSSSLQGWVFAGIVGMLVGIAVSPFLIPRGIGAPPATQPEATVKKERAAFLAKVRSRLGRERTLWVTAERNDGTGIWESSIAFDFLPDGMLISSMKSLAEHGGWSMGDRFLRAYDREGNFLGEYGIYVPPEEIGQKPTGSKPPTNSGDRPPDA